jgi:hypothetical protein
MHVCTCCSLLLVFGIVTHAHLHVVTDPDGTSLQQDDVEAIKDVSLKKIAHQAPPILAHEVARQLLAERRIAKLKAHLEQAEVKLLLKNQCVELFSDKISIFRYELWRKIFGSKF